jgi:hypothetical protein
MLTFWEVKCRVDVKTRNAVYNLEPVYKMEQNGRVWVTNPASVRVLTVTVVDINRR